MLAGPRFPACLLKNQRDVRPPTRLVQDWNFTRGSKVVGSFLSSPQKTQRWTSLPILYRAVTITQPNSASSCLSWIFVELVSYCPQIALQTPMVSFKDRRVHRVIIGLQSFMEGISLNVRLDFAFFFGGSPTSTPGFLGNLTPYLNSSLEVLEVLVAQKFNLIPGNHNCHGWNFPKSL